MWTMLYKNNKAFPPFLKTPCQVNDKGSFFMLDADLKILDKRINLNDPICWSK